jgi:hypothetical protein
MQSRAMTFHFLVLYLPKIVQNSQGCNTKLTRAFLGLEQVSKQILITRHPDPFYTLRLRPRKDPRSIGPDFQFDP